MVARNGKTVKVVGGKVFVDGITIGDAEKLQEMFDNKLDIKTRGNTAEIVPSAAMTPTDLAFEIGDHFNTPVMGLRGHNCRVAYARQ